MGISAAVVGGAVIGGVASNAAAGKQANAANNAADQQAQAAANIRSDLSPYTSLGQQAINPLWAAMGYQATPNQQAIQQAQDQLNSYISGSKLHPEWDPAAIQQQIAQYQQQLTDAQNGVGQQMTINPNSPLQQQFNFDPSQLANTPGYQFTMQQGLRGVQNQLASQGLGLSGAQIKGAEGYATGLANQTYGDQYNRALSTYNTNYQTAANNVNRLQNLVNVGQNSAAQTGQAGIQSANNAGNYLTQAGNAQASGIIGGSNAAQNGLQNYMLYNSLYGNNNSGNTPSTVNLGDTFSGFNFN